MDEKKILLCANHVSKIYGAGETEVIALNDISFNIKEGELLVIMGSSGSGKSTLLNIVGGMDKATKGIIEVDGQDINEYSERKLTIYRKDKVGFIFQFYNLIPDLTAYENVELAAQLSKNPIFVDSALEMVELLHKKNNYPTQLSGGEQQRVSIARALVKQSSFLLCDEPTGALDYNTGKQVLKVLEGIARIYNKTVVIVTHCSPISFIADRVIVLSSGKIVEEIVNACPMNADEVKW